HGAIVERFFGNLAKKIKRLLKNKGAIQSSNPKDIQNAARTACLLYEDIYRFIVEEIVRYQNSPHSELNQMTPNQKWQEACEVIGLPAVPAKTAKLQRMFLREHPKKLIRRNKGLALFGLHYDSKKLKMRFQSDDTGKDFEYTIKYDPLDISKVYVWC